MTQPSYDFNANPINYTKQLLDMVNDIPSPSISTPLIKLEETTKQLEILHRFFTLYKQVFDPDALEEVGRRINERIIENKKVMDSAVDLGMVTDLFTQFNKLKDIDEEIRRVKSGQIVTPVIEPPIPEVQRSRGKAIASWSPDEIKKTIEQISKNQLDKLNKEKHLLNIKQDPNKVDNLSEVKHSYNTKKESINKHLYAILGEKYLHGRIGVPINLEKAADLFGSGVIRHDLISKFLYANCLDEGLGIKQNPILAKEYWKEAFEGLKKNKKSASGEHDYYMALCYLECKGIENDLEGKGLKCGSKEAQEHCRKIAEEYFVKSATKGYGQAFVALGKNFPGSFNEFYKEDNEFFKASDKEDMLHNAAKLGCSEAYYELGFLYFNTARMDNSLENLKKGVEAGNLNSLLQLAEYYQIENNKSVVKAIVQEAKKYISKENAPTDYSKLESLEKWTQTPLEPLPPLETTET